jgi:hypothetical protein
MVEELCRVKCLFGSGDVQPEATGEASGPSIVVGWAPVTKRVWKGF